MSKPKPPIARLADLQPGQVADFFALLAEKSKSATRDGKPFFSCRFKDRHRTVSCMIWADGGWYQPCEEDWREGKFYKLRARFNEHERYGPQIELQQVRHVIDADHDDGFNPADFVEASRHDPEAMFAELHKLAEEQIADEPLRKLVVTLLDRHAGPLKRLPATQKHFFPFAGGLLEHLLSVTHSCIAMADKYLAAYPHLHPPLNRDLVVAGAVLHDIGRVLEFQDDILAPTPTVPGRLFGHHFLGRDLVRDTARELADVNPELVQLLEHIVITHLVIPEWGSPRLPMIPEVLIIHHCDDLDAKMEMYARCLTKDQSAGPFTDRDPVLGKVLYKGRSV